MGAPGLPLARAADHRSWERHCGFPDVCVLLPSGCRAACGVSGRPRGRTLDALVITYE